MKYTITYLDNPQGYRVRIWEPIPGGSPPYLFAVNFYGIATQAEAIQLVCQFKEDQQHHAAQYHAA